MKHTLIFLIVLAAAAARGAEFEAARPVWPAGQERATNITVGFRAAVDAGGARHVTLRLAGSTLYRFFVNGAFAGHGPARGPHGFFRVDEWDVSRRVKPGTNVFAVEVAGYNVNSFYLLDQPSFLQAELVADGRVLAATAPDGGGWTARRLPERVQRVQRYSFQRPFIEVYRLEADSARWRTDAAAGGPALPLAAQPAGPLLPRRVPYPDFAARPAWKLIARGETREQAPANPWRDRSLTQIGPKLGGFPEADLEVVLSRDLQSRPTARLEPADQPWPAAGVALAAGRFAVADFGTNLSGFIRLRASCRAPARVAVLFDELQQKGDVNFLRLSTVSAVDFRLGPGGYDVLSFEPYTFRYAKVLCLEGEVEVQGLGLVEYANPDVAGARFAASDPQLGRVFEAARETFRQNAVDVFMDCPHRERAGWLCDSFFTARAAFDFSGDTAVEDAFLENYALPPSFKHLPDGMLPMCYPSDHNDGVFIPNWALWLVVELEEYAARGGDKAVIEKLRPRVLRLLEFFRGLENADGLLEKLPSWVFVEWSKANSFVQDVNYPSNMLYAGALRAAARLYGLPDLAARADRVLAAVRQQSFDGRFFVDNAVRTPEGLKVTTNRTEVCQYFAFQFGAATPETHPELWKSLLEEFGPKRKETKAHPDVHPANAFIGNVLRLELLSRAGRPRQILEESLAFNLYMAERTGTLWENVDPSASCNHGFASHAAHVLYRDVLGLRRVDPVARRVEVRIPDAPLEWCEGALPVPGGTVELRWWREGGTVRHRLTLPEGYTSTAAGP